MENCAVLFSFIAQGLHVLPYVWVHWRTCNFWFLSGHQSQPKFQLTVFNKLQCQIINRSHDLI